MRYQIADVVDLIALPVHIQDRGLAVDPRGGRDSCAPLQVEIRQQRRIQSRWPGDADRHKAELSAVLAALRRLSEVDRAALLMRVQEEMPYEEIAQALKLPVTTVKVKVHRARLKLMQARETFQEVRP